MTPSRRAEQIRFLNIYFFLSLSLINYYLTQTPLRENSVPTLFFSAFRSLFWKKISKNSAFQAVTQCIKYKSKHFDCSVVPPTLQLSRAWLDGGALTALIGPVVGSMAPSSWAKYISYFIISVFKKMLHLSDIWRCLCVCLWLCVWNGAGGLGGSQHFPTRGPTREGRVIW